MSRRVIRKYYRNWIEYKIKFPTKPEAWVLYDETNFWSSVWSVNSKFKQSWWGTTYWTATAYDTTNKRIYSNSTHSKAAISFTEAAYDDIGNAKKVKIVYDYLYVPNNTNTYSSWVFWFLHAWEKKSSWYDIYWSWTYTLSSWAGFAHSVEYKWELVYDLVNDSWTFIFTNLSNQEKSIYNVSWWKQYWVKGWNNKSLFLWNREADSWTVLWWQVRDQWTTSYFWDMHVYVIL